MFRRYEAVLLVSTEILLTRPLIILRAGSREWKALVEAKIGSTDLDEQQVERYRAIAKEHGLDCVITISNQFATDPSSHPVDAIRRSRSKVPVFHWSWMHILTAAELLIRNEGVEDTDQKILLNELRRFLTHESVGVRGFERMPREWTDLNKLVSSGGKIPARSKEAAAVIEAWHQETRDLSLILSRMTEEEVAEKLSKKHRNNPSERQSDELNLLREDYQLHCTLQIPHAAAPIEIVADLMRRSVDVGMTLRAPDDRVSTNARVNWLLRQVKSENLDGIHLRLLWPGKSEATQHPLADIIQDTSICAEGKQHLAPHGFHIFLSERLGARFTQQSNFIDELERIVPLFYREVGSSLSAWKKKAPRIKDTKPTAEDVSTSALSEDAKDFEP